MFHNFHFVQSDMGQGIENAVSREKVVRLQ